MVTTDGDAYRLKNYEFKKAKTALATGYKIVWMNIKGKQKHYYLHRLIAEAFIPNPDNKPQVNHIDGNKTNNNVENLEWVTSKENVHHAIRTGLMKPSDFPNAKM